MTTQHLRSNFGRWIVRTLHIQLQPAARPVDELWSDPAAYPSMQADPQTPPPPPTTTDEATPGGALADKATETYKWWNNLATLHPEDPFLVGAGKIGIRLIGILVLLAMSPLIILGLIVAFITVL